MSERETTAPRTRRPSAAQVAAGRANLAKGTAARQKRAAEARESGALGAKQKWAMLLSGQLTVKDMDDEELARVQFRTKAGDFSGGRRKMIPSHIAQQIQAEKIRRADAGLKDLLPAAVKALKEIIENGADGEVVKTADITKAVAMVLDRGLGKPEQKVQMNVTETPWDKVTAEALEVDRDLADLIDE